MQSTEKLINPPAFSRPSSADINHNTDNPIERPAQEGMTLRDYFAAKAMQSLITAANDTMIANINQGIPIEMATVHFDKSIALTVPAAYHMADLMLAERTKEVSNG